MTHEFGLKSLWEYLATWNKLHSWQDHHRHDIILTTHWWKKHPLSVSALASGCIPMSKYCFTIWYDAAQISTAEWVLVLSIITRLNQNLTSARVPIKSGLFSRNCCVCGSMTPQELNMSICSSWTLFDLSFWTMLFWLVTQLLNCVLLALPLAMAPIL